MLRTTMSSGFPAVFCIVLNPLFHFVLKHVAGEGFQRARGRLRRLGRQVRPRIKHRHNLITLRVKTTCNALGDSDAIGMGLNLNIDRVVFAEV